MRKVCLYLEHMLTFGSRWSGDRQNCDTSNTCCRVNNMSYFLIQIFFFLFWFSYFKLVSHTSSSFILSTQSYEPDQVGDFQKLSSLSLAWSVKPVCPNAAHKPVQNLKQSNLDISFWDNGVHSEHCAVDCVAFTVQYAGTCRLLPFLMTIAPAWLFPLQIHIWLSKLIQWCPVALDSLVWPPALHQRRTIISHPL